MTAPAENSHAGDKHGGSLAQVVRWLTEERAASGSEDPGFVGAPRRLTRWTYGDLPAPQPKLDAEVDPLREVRVGPAPRCAVAGETIALSVSLVDTRGRSYLGWPVKLEWSSSDPTVASVNEIGVVEVKAKGRVELTCTCEGVSGTISLTVIDPDVAVAVGLPVPAHARARAVPDDVRLTVPRARTASARKASPPAPRPIPPQPPPPHRRSVERGSVRPGPFAAFGLSRAARRTLFRIGVAGATGAVIALVLTGTPEDYFVVNAEAHRAATTTTLRATSAAVAAVARPSAEKPKREVPQTAIGATASVASATIVDAPPSRVVSEAYGATSNTSAPAITTAPATTPPEGAAPSVNRVVLAPSSSQLSEGESVRLSAAGVDARGVTVSGGVTWTSENSDVATVDANGVVTARKPGTVTIVAASEGRTGRVTLSVGARRSAATGEDPAPRAAPARETQPLETPRPRANSAAVAAEVLRSRADEFVQALRERNSARVAELYNPATAEDRKNLQQLLERLKRSESRLKASDAQLGASTVSEAEGTGEFAVPMSWTTSFGRVRNQTSTFRAVLEPAEGGWRVVAIRAVGKID